MSNRLYTALIITIFVAVVVAMASCSCSRRSRLADRLDLAESLMWTAPDSALSVLKTVYADSLSKGEERARYALLYTMAMDKNHLNPTNDSLIASAVDYYRSKNNAPRLMVADFYRGRVQQHNGRYPQALLSFYQAKELAEKSDSSFWAGMACRGISDIYLETYNRTEELTFAKKEYEYLKRSGRQPYLNYALLDLGRAYCNNKYTQKAIAIAEQLIDSAIISEDPYLHYCALYLKSNTLINDKNYSRAYPVLQAICDGEFAEAIDSLNLSLVLAHENKGEEALRLMDEISDTHPGVKNMISYVVYKNARQYDKAVIEAERTEHVSDSILRASMSRNLAGSLSDYFEIDKKINLSEVKAVRLRNWLLVISFIVAMTLLISVSLRIYRRQKHAIDQKVLFAEQLNRELVKSRDDLAKGSNALDKIKEILSVANSNLDKTREDLNIAREDLDITQGTLNKTEKDLEATKEALGKTKMDLAKAKEHLNKINAENKGAFDIIKFLQSTKYELLEELSEIVRCNKDSNKATVKIANVVTKLIDDLSSHSKKVEELENNVNSLYNNLFSDFRSDLPKLKEADYRLFLFSILQLSNNTISLFLKEDKIIAVYNRKKRLKTKIRELEPKKADRYLQYL